MKIKNNLWKVLLPATFVILLCGANAVSAQNVQSTHDFTIQITDYP